MALSAAPVLLALPENIDENTIVNGHNLSPKQDKELPISCNTQSEQACNESIKIDNDNNSGINKTTVNGFCYHVGILIFAPLLKKLKKSSLGDCSNLVIQLLVSVLLGAKNIEQTKFLNFKSLKILLGKNVIRNLNTQRQKLKEFSTDENIDKLLSFNAELINVNKETDFYYDIIQSIIPDYVKY